MLSSRRLSWSSTQFSICPRCHPFRPASGFSAYLAEPRSHPFLRSKKFLQQSRHINVGVQFRKINPKSRRTDFNCIQLRRLGALQSLRIARRKTDTQSRTQFHDDALALPVVSRRNCFRYRARPPICRLNRTCCHVSTLTHNLSP
jgi:hypothetical protein